MKKNLRKILILSIVFLYVILTNKVYAENLKVKVPELTEEYKKWITLGDKQNQTIKQPIAVSIPFESQSKDYKSSRINMLNNLKSSLGSSYNLKDEINIKVKDQGTNDRCWAFSLTSILETNLSKMTNGITNKIFSPIHMDYWVYNNSNSLFNNGGKPLLGLAYCTAGAGPVEESEELSLYIDSHENKETHTNSLSYPDTYISGFKNEFQVEKYTIFPTIIKNYDLNGSITYTNGLTGTNLKEYNSDEINKMRNLIKEHIQEFGGASGYIYAKNSDFLNYYDINNYSYFNNDNTKSANHQVTIVGWDDNFSKDKFKITPPGDGAWIVLNSWGEENNMNKGYFYVSYYDKDIDNNAIGINNVSEKKYNNIYQHDELGYTCHLQIENGFYQANIFEKNTDKTEYLQKVSFYACDYSNIEIYYAKWDKVNKKIVGEKQLIKKLNASDISNNGFFTYYTYNLSDDELIKIDDEFAIIIRKITNEKIVNIPVEIYFESLSDNTKSNKEWKNITTNGEGGYVSSDANTWIDLNSFSIQNSEYKYYIESADLCIKAFTSYLDNINVKSVSLNIEKSEMNEGDTLQLAATVSPKTATNKEVTWKSSNEEVAKVDENGKVTAKSAGKATIIVTTKDQAKTASCEITVNEKPKDILVTQIDLDENQKEIYIGDKFKINATITPDNATNKELTWETEDKTIATVSNDGTVTGVAKGKVTIKVTNKASGKSAVCVVTVLDKKEDEYYKEQEEKIVENTNNTDTTDNQENTVNNSTEEIQTTDDTTYGAIIPQTGIKAEIKIVLIVIASIGIISFVKYYRRRDV